MSRIILKQYDNGENHIVVGWDRPCASFFWQEFAKEPEVVQRGEVWVVEHSQAANSTFQSQGEAEHHKWDGWEEMIAFAGYMPNELPTLLTFKDSLPDNIKPLVTDDVLRVLNEHATMDQSEVGRVVVDMTKDDPKTSFKVEVQTFGESNWASNAVRFATAQEAEQAALDLAGRWSMVEKWRVASSDDPVNYKWEGGRAVSV